MTEKTERREPNGSLPKGTGGDMRVQALRAYTRLLDMVVVILVFVMLLTLVGAVAGLLFDFVVAVHTLMDLTATFGMTHAYDVAGDLGRGLVVSVLSTFVLIELFRTFTDYLEFHRIRLRVLAEVGIVFVLREMFIGLYAHRMNWQELLAIAALLAVLVATRVAAIQFAPRQRDE